MDRSNWKGILVWVVICCLCFFGIPIKLKGNKSTLETSFKDYALAFNKSYSQDEITNRLPHFEKSLSRISELNSNDSHLLKLSSFSSSHSLKWHEGLPKSEGSASWGLTEFSDLSPEEFQDKYLDKNLLTRILSRDSQRKSHIVNHYKKFEYTIGRKKRSTTIPDRMDWRTKGIISSVKHQKDCGACWAFSTVETVESMHALRSGAITPLSVQQVVNCATNGNMGCKGGDTCSALQWISENKIVTENDYPLTLKDGTCGVKSSSMGITINSNHTCNNFEGSENSILNLLARHGPVVAAVDATNWQYYVGGVIKFNCESNNNHAIQIVGYDKTTDTPHYIVRNSWGNSFGDNGYLYIAIGSNLCGIAREVSALSVKP